MTEEIIKMQIDEFYASAHKGQETYLLNEQAHKIMSVLIDGEPVEFEVFLRLKDIPERYGELRIKVAEKIREGKSRGGD